VLKGKNALSKFQLEGKKNILFGEGITFGRGRPLGKKRGKR